MAKYADDVQTISTPQMEPVRGKDQIQNRAGGFGFKVDDWHRLDRFLILGHEGGTYYATQRELSLETVTCLDRCLAEDATRTVQTIVDVSLSGRAPKNDPAIFALAYVASSGNAEAATLALSKLKSVCRIGTHLFDFLTVCKTLGRGWGRGFMRHVGAWYDRNPDKLAMQVTKYAQRNGWSHRDVLRKCHFHTEDAAVGNVLKYVAQHDQWLEAENIGSGADEFLAAVDEAKDESTGEHRVLELIADYSLVREHLATQHLNRVPVWEALLSKMPLTAMIRNLGKMTSIGLTVPLSNASAQVCAALADVEALKRQRVHPVALLVAQKMYHRGAGLRGSLSWNPDQTILSALDNAFYAAFDVVEPTGQKFMLGVDVSNSMCSPCFGSEVLTCTEAAAAMAMLAARTEPQTYVFGFAHQFRDLKITARDSLVDACRKAHDSNFGGTDCGLPIYHARTNNLDVDVFCIYTDNETWAGGSSIGQSHWGRRATPSLSGHVFQELEQYRQHTGKAAKLAVFGLAQTDFTVADPDDPHQMDFVGFDATAPTLLADLARL